MDRISRAIRTAHRSHDREHDFLDEADLRFLQLSGSTLRANGVVDYRANSPVADAYRLLRTRLLQKMRQNNWQTLGVTSAESGAGKTLTAINLAIAMAMDENQSVVLVDADIREPAVAATLGIQARTGLVNYLRSDETDFRRSLLRTSIDNLYVIPCEKQTDVTSEILSSPRMREVLSELSSMPHYKVICDLPPVLLGDDVIAFSGFLDAYMMVVNDGKTAATELARAAKLLEAVPLAGSVLNCSRELERGL